jgi:hypothetical protein
LTIAPGLLMATPRRWARPYVDVSEVVHESDVVNIYIRRRMPLTAAILVTGSGGQLVAHTTRFALPRVSYVLTSAGFSIRTHVVTLLNPGIRWPPR